MYLTEHFSLEEMTTTQVRGVDNSCPTRLLPHLRNTAMVMEKVRDLLGGKPITVSSGYRCPAVNKAVGGAENSAHLDGYAADFICPSFGTPLEICRAIEASQIGFDQVINEGAHGNSLGWVHISVAPGMRRQVLTATFANGKAQYSTGLS